MPAVNRFLKVTRPEWPVDTDSHWKLNSCSDGRFSAEVTQSNPNSTDKIDNLKHAVSFGLRKGLVEIRGESAAYGAWLGYR
jgi:hypothetical protein